MNYPPAERADVVDVIHGHEVADPYRWLEDPDDPRTQEWSAAQDDLAFPRLAGLPGRDRFAERLRALTPGVVTLPYVVGERAFFMRRQPGQDHAALWLREGRTERVLLDPNVLSEDGTVTLDGWTPSKEGERLAYLLSEGGDEEASVYVLDVATGAVLDGPIDRCRYSPIAWVPGGEELYYVRRLPGEPVYHRRVYRHRIGAGTEHDTMVFGDGRDKTTYYGVATSRDGRWLIVSASLGTAPRNDVFIADLHADKPHRFTVVQEGEDVETTAFVHLDGRLYLHTDRDAPRRRLAVADPTAPQPENWQELLPETDAVLEDVTITRDAVVAARSRHAVSEVTVHDKRTGASRAAVALPGLGYAATTGRADGGDDVWVAYTDYVTPMRVLHYHIGTEALSVWAEPPGDVEVKGVVTELVTYQSKDGTPIRLFLIRPDDARRDGRRPTILYGYGGFNVSMIPAYRSSIAAWVECGGVYAVACLRGGAEEGEDWHRAGMREHKQNVFDDFIAAAEWLMGDGGWTDRDRLGVMGGSNGGLLVGALVTQRPDLFSAAVCGAPLLDMVRYEQFGLGETWNDEYGTAADPDEFEWLLGYSPYHRVEAGVRYPAVLFTVFDSDTRVDPNHARKMCAALQAATASERPIVLRRESKVGHGARSVSRMVDREADQLAFFAEELGLGLTTL